VPCDDPVAMSDLTLSRQPTVRAVGRTRVGTRARLLGWIVCSRVLVLATTLVLTHVREPRGHFSDAVLDRPLGPLAAWDGRWYGEVAKHGYSLVPGEKSSAAFFPLLPWLVAGFRSVFDAGPIVAGLLIANVLFVAAIFALYELGRLVLPEQVAYRAAVFAAISPLAFVFSMFYAESLALAAVAAAGVCALRGRWVLAIPFAAAAALARPGGAFVFLPILGAALAAWPDLRARSRGAAVAAVAAAPIALAILPLVLWWETGDPLAWAHAQAAWGRSLSPGGVAQLLTALPEALRGDLWVAREVALVVAAAGLLVCARRAGVDRWWIAAGALMALLPLASGSWESAGRYALIAPPVYWGLASLVRGGRSETAARMALLVALVVGTLTLGLVNP
jgi:hypothetical protein